MYCLRSISHFNAIAIGSNYDISMRGKNYYHLTFVPETHTWYFPLFHYCRFNWQNDFFETLYLN